AGFGREFEIRTFHDGIHRACFLAETAIDALHHVNVVTHRTAGAVVAARTGLDGNSLRRADRFAKLAGDAAFFTVRITAQRMFATETRRDRTLFMRVVQRRLRREELAHGKEKRTNKFLEKERFGCLSE